MVFILDFFILKWWATADIDLTLRYISSNSNFSCNVISFTSFLGALTVLLVALHMAPMVLFKVYGITLNMIKNTRELRGITFYCDTQFTKEVNSLGRDY